MDRIADRRQQPTAESQLPGLGVGQRDRYQAARVGELNLTAHVVGDHRELAARVGAEDSVAPTIRRRIPVPGRDIETGYRAVEIRELVFRANLRDRASELCRVDSDPEGIRCYPEILVLVTFRGDVVQAVVRAVLGP